MYIPKEFENRDPNVTWDFIEKNNFGMLVSARNSEPYITHLPFVPKKIESQLFLEAHLALANPHVHVLQDGDTVKIVLNGPHGYVSSSVYNHPNVPTWNYQTVHITGKITRLTEEGLEKHLSELVDLHEKERTAPLNYEGFDQNLVQSYLKEIVGFRIQIEKTEAAFKLSQNRSSEDYQAILGDLDKCPINHELVKAMRKNKEA